jgi:hypothetical protein
LEHGIDKVYLSAVIEKLEFLSDSDCVVRVFAFVEQIVFAVIC